MSLLNKNKAFSVRDYLFVAVGLLGLFWFFLSYASNEPRSIMDTSLDKQSAGAKAVQTLDNLGYKTDIFNTRINFSSNESLLDSLQRQLGRRKMIQTLTDSVYDGIYPYMWEIHFSGAELDRKVTDESGEPRDMDMIIRLNERGQLIEFLNPRERLPDQIINRKALIFAFQTDSTLKLWTALPDSAWDRMLSFNLEKGYSAVPDTLRRKRESFPHEFSREEVRRLAEYHLKAGGWNPEKLSLKEIQIRTVKSNTAAELTFQNTEPNLGQTVRLQATVLPTGTLLSLDASYNNAPSNGNFSSQDILSLIRAIVILLFGIAGIIIFYFRIRARAVDTNPALVVGVLAGLIVPAVILLKGLEEIPLFNGAGTSDILGLALQMGFGGAFASIGFFVLFAIADSLMRQYWPEKLSVYDYLRQGMFFNKPIGETLIRSEILAFLLCGLWTTLLFFFPDLYYEVQRGFLEYEAVWPVAFLFLNSAWFNLMTVLGIFCVFGTQIYGVSRNIWVTVLAMVSVFALMGPVIQDMGPVLQEILLFVFMGFVFTYIFFKWDFLTTLLSHFLFICLLEVSSGWVVPDSPDLYVFITFCGFLLFISVIGVLAIVKGKERQSLPTFVPEYVEELAQEQRIKQELQIAREVQQSFLPVQTPEFEHLELAGICKPAYETGGDYYDFVPIDDHRVAVTIGDVSGKGIQAAFYMTFVKGVIHSLCREIESPAEILKKTNRLFCDNAPRGTFISLIYGIVDLREQTFHFARAGHNPIIRITSENGQVEELQPKGIGIGLTQGETFARTIEETKLSLSEDDLLVLYTDGIVEALNERNTFYGTQRLNNILKVNKARSAKQILELLSSDVQSFIGSAKQHDDMTVMIMKFKSATTIEA